MIYEAPYEVRPFTPQIYLILIVYFVHISRIEMVSREYLRLTGSTAISCEEIDHPQNAGTWYPETTRKDKFLLGTLMSKVISFIFVYVRVRIAVPKPDPTNNELYFPVIVSNFLICIYGSLLRLFSDVFIVWAN